MATTGNKRLLAVIATVVVVTVVILPALLGYRYTAPEQRAAFLRHPWRGWAFVYSALAVPADSELKTSGMALRKAEWVFRGSSLDPKEVQLVFTEAGRPYSFVHALNGRHLTATVTPKYRFLWQVTGAVVGIDDSDGTLLAVFDYETGRILYDVRNDLLPSDLPQRPSTSPSPGAVQ